jgi:hypothetical protein
VRRKRAFKKEQNNTRYKRLKNDNRDNNNNLQHRYTRFVGLDPGVINYVGGCVLDTLNNHSEMNSLLHSNKYKQKYCGERARKRKLHRIDAELRRAEETYQAEKKLNCKISTSFELLLDFTRYKLLFFERREATYRRRRNYCRWSKWDSHVMRQQAKDRLVNFYVPNERDRVCTLVCFGDGSLEQGISYGMKRKPAVKRLRTLFCKRHCDIIDVDEYKTTKMCSKCMCMEMSLPPKIHYNDENVKKRQCCAYH